jgi:2-oxoglutarate dehydrogenase E2 component (dihydrolipoamide succinyltransferase)
VKEDEVLFEVSTDKVDSEVPSPVAGYVSEIRVPEGDTVDVGSVLAVITDAPPGDAPAKEEAPAAEPEAAPAAPEEEPEPQPEAEPAAQEEEPGPQPAAQEKPEQPQSKPAAKAEPAKSDSGGKVLSPVVRRLISEHGLDPAQIKGTGAGGRITRNDVLAVVESGPKATAPAAAATAPAAKREQPKPEPVARTGERDTAVPFSNIRKRTAEHMIRSKQTSAHVYAAIEVDYEAVERVRREEKDAWKSEEGFSLTYLPFISRAVMDAIHEFPEVNASYGENELILHNYVNLGIAVDLDFKGLMVPVIHDAETKRLRAIAREISDLATRTRAKKLSPDEIVGGTFTITNPGPFGTLLTLPIINQPQVAILSTDGVKRRPVVVDLPDGSEGIAIHSVGNLALAWDHRAFDGAYAAAFLRGMRSALEQHNWEDELD